MADPNDDEIVLLTERSPSPGRPAKVRVLTQDVGTSLDLAKAGRWLATYVDAGDPGIPPLPTGPAFGGAKGPHPPAGASEAMASVKVEALKAAEDAAAGRFRFEEGDARTEELAALALRTRNAEAAARDRVELRADRQRRKAVARDVSPARASKGRN